jgi:hypothetical protein
MDFWTAIVIIIAIVFITGTIQSRHKLRAKDGQVDSTALRRIEELERRVESLETLVIDLDKEQRFRDLKR